MFYTAENFFFVDKHSFKPIQNRFQPSTNSLTNFNTALEFQLQSFTVIGRKTFCLTGSYWQIFLGLICFDLVKIQTRPLLEILTQGLLNRPKNYFLS